MFFGVDKAVLARRLGVLLGVVWLAAYPAVAAESVIRCRLPGGRVIFSDRACSAGVQDELLIEDRRVGWIAPRTPLRLKRPELARRLAHKKATRLRAARKKRRRREKDCWKKRQQVERIQERLRRGYRAGQGRTLRYRQREVEAYLRAFCK